MTPKVKAPSRHVVIRIDLRGDAQAKFDRVPLGQLVADELRSQGLDVAESSRALVIGDAAELPDQIAAYQRVRSVHGFSRMLFLLFGEPPGDRQGVDRDPWVLACPPLPTEPGAAGVVWAGSTHGIGWRPGRSDVLTHSGKEDDPLFADALIEVLTLPAIFDAVLGQLGRLSAPVAGLGLRLINHDVPDSDVRRALRQAGLQLSGARGAGAEDRAARGPVAVGQSGKVLELLLGTRPVEKVTFEDCVRPQSQLRRLAEDCAAVLGEVDHATEQLGRFSTLLFGLRGNSPAALLAEGAGALTEYRAALEETLVEVDGSMGLEPAARAHLNALDVQIPEVPQLTARRIDAALRDEVLACLDRRMPLNAAAAYLADLDGRMAPVGSAARADELERACPTELLESMVGARIFPIRRTAGVWAAGGALCGLLAGLWPQVGLAAGPVVALLGAAGLALAAYRSPERGSNGLGEPPGTVRHLAAGLAGAAVGIAIGFSATPPKPVGAAGLLVALGLTLFLTARRWTAAVAGWRRAAGLDDAHTALDRLRGILRQAVLNDWLLADPKYQAADRARALGGLLQRLTDSLEAAVEEIAAEKYEDDVAPGGWIDSGYHASPGADGDGDDWDDEDGEPGRTMLDEGNELRDLLVADLADLTADLVLGYLPRVGRDPEAVYRLPVEEDVRDAVARLRRHQAHDGIAEPPAFTRRSGARPDTIRLAGVDPARIRQAIAVGDDSPDVRQLCTRDQLRMLNREPGASLWVRFAHHSLQHAEQRAAAASRSAGGAGLATGSSQARDRPADRMAWLSSSRFAGALRLTPLQIGAAKTVRAAAARPGTEVQ